MSDQLHHDEDFRGRIDWTVWREIAAHARPYRRSVAGLAISGLVIAALDALFPFVTGRLIDHAVESGLSAGLWLWFGGYAALMLVFVVSVWLLIVLAGRVATGVAFDLREAGFRKLQELSFSYFDTRPVGWLVSRLTADCQKISSLLPWFALDLFWGTSLIVAIIAAMFWLHAPLALAVCLIVPPLAAATWYFQRRLLESSRLMRRTNSQITASFNECIMGVRTTKALVREAENLGEFQVLSSSQYRHSMRNALESAVYLPLVIAIGSVGVGLSLWRGGVTIGEGITLGELVAFMQYAATLYMPIQELARRFTELQAAQAAAERIQGLLSTVPEIADSPEVQRAIEAQSARTPASGIAPDGFADRIDTVEFRGVSFWYLEGDPVLRDFNLTVRQGQTVALVGATGGGKSTIVSLLARFYEPREGEVLIDGVDYRQRSLGWLQSRLGVVLQSPYLFSGTVRENIRYGRLDASDEEVEAAARLVNAEAFILDLDDGYESEVGEGGQRLSTGQRQLVSLARAVLADPAIFIMDEATSSIDTETERLIQGAIDTVLADRMAFVIAHRLSTIRRADVILVIDHGRIVEQGAHQELLARTGRYHALYQRQFVREREAALLE